MNDELWEGTEIQTSNHDCRIRMNTHGNLEIYQNKVLRWMSGVQSSGSYVAKLKRNGNFIIKDPNQKGYFRTNTSKDHQLGVHTYTFEVDSNCIPFICQCFKGAGNDQCRIIW